MKLNERFLAAGLILILPISTLAQTGGGFTITQSVVASGGGQSSSGGAFALDDTIGQSLAGVNSTGGAFGVSGGFWTQQLAPTAAAVTVGGRVVSPRGNGIRNVVVTMTDQSGATRTAASGAAGRFQFNDVPSGGIYIFSVRSRRFWFSQPVIVRYVIEDVDDLVFVADY